MRYIESNRRRAPHRSCLAATAWPVTWLAVVTALCILAVPPTARADDGATAGGSAGSSLDTIDAIGLGFEEAILLSPAERVPALRAGLDALQVLERRGDARDERGARRFLVAQHVFVLEQYEDAAEAFDKSRKELGQPFEDDAAYAAIITLEAAGNDVEAARAWEKFANDHAGSPLIGEARLARAWNALRRGDRAAAEVQLRTLQETMPWMADDARLRLVLATVDFLKDDPQSALARLDMQSSSPAGLFLGALCQTQLGAPLQAAALFQRTVESAEDSPLRDLALLAKADIFLHSGAYRSAAEEFGRVASTATGAWVRAEAELRRAASLFLDGDSQVAIEALTEVTLAHRGTSQAARAQYLVAEVRMKDGDHEAAIVEFNRLLTEYFQSDLAASAQYRLGRCYSALDRHAEATGAYQAVVSGYSQAEEAPAAAYLAGAGLVAAGRHAEAAPYFQLVLDRYAHSDAPDATVAIEDAKRAGQEELVEASLCMLATAYRRAGDLGQLSVVAQLVLERMPPSQSPWRAYSLLIAADALASQHRHDAAQAALDRLMSTFPDHPAVVPAGRLLAWTYAQQGDTQRSLAIEKQMLEHHAASGSAELLSSAYLNRAHVFFNDRRYDEAAAAYQRFLTDYPQSPRRATARHQLGLCYLRLDRAGDAVDSWESLVAENPDAAIAEEAWMRAGDLYFHSQHYADAERSYRGLVEHFATSERVPVAELRIAQCAYNAGEDREALARYSRVAEAYPASDEGRQAAEGVTMALYRLGQREDGDAVLAQLVDEYPSSSFAADAQFELALRAYNDERHAEAAELFRRVVTQFPGYASADRAQFLMAESYRQTASLEQAQRGYEQFMLFFGESELRSTVRFRIGELRFEAGDYMRAAVDFTGVLEAGEPTDIRGAALYNLGLCHKLLGQNEQAQQTFERYRSEGDDSEYEMHVAYQLGDLHRTAGRFDRAATELDRALDMKPGGSLAAEIGYLLGGCREELGERQAARRAYKQSMSSGESADTFRLAAAARLAALAEEDGDESAARRAYAEIARNSDDPELAAAAAERAAALGGAAD